MWCIYPGVALLDINTKLFTANIEYFKPFGGKDFPKIPKRREKARKRTKIKISRSFMKYMY